MEQTDKVLENTLTVKRKRIMTYFIEATEKLIRSEGTAFPSGRSPARRGITAPPSITTSTTWRS